MDVSKTIHYIKCLNRTDLIKFLREENYTVVADILRLRDIDGIRFLELNELDLVQWRLNPKQKKLILECRDQMIGKITPQTVNKPPLAMKPAQLLRPRVSSDNGKIADLQSKLQLENKIFNVTTQTHTKSKVLSKTNKQNLNDDVDYDHYMHMMQDNASAPSRPVKNMNVNVVISNKNMPSQFPHMMQNTQKKVVKSMSPINPSELGTKPLNKYYNESQRSLPTPPQLLSLPIQNRHFNRGIQDNEENYENPDDIKSERFEDQDIYEDPDTGKNKKTLDQILASSITQNLKMYEDNYEDPNVIENGRIIANRMPALPKRPFSFPKNKSNFEESDYEEPEGISKNQINKMHQLNDVRPQRSTQSFSNLNKPSAGNKFQDETYEQPDEVRKNPKIMPTFKKPLNFSQNRIQDELYADQKFLSESLKNRMHPSELIMKHPTPKKTQISSENDTYEDPDMVRGNYFGKNTIESPEEEDYEIPLEQKQIQNQKTGLMSKRLPPLPAKSFAEDGLPAVPPKHKDVARKRSENDSLKNEPYLRDLRYSHKQDLPPVPCGYDNHRLSKKTNMSLMKINSSDVTRSSAIRQIRTNVCWDGSLPSPPLPFISTLPEKKCDIWNSFDQSGFPTPQKFECKFKHADSAMRMYVEGEEHRISSENSNPNDFPFFRNTDRIGGRQLLERIKNIQNGAFLIRKSKEFFLVITMFHENRFYNVGIDKNDDGSIYCKTIKNEEPKSFKTLYQFVEYYKSHPLSVTTKGTVINIYLIEQLPPEIF